MENGDGAFVSRFRQSERIGEIRFFDDSCLDGFTGDRPFGHRRLETAGTPTAAGFLAVVDPQMRDGARGRARTMMDGVAGREGGVDHVAGEQLHDTAARSRLPQQAFGVDERARMPVHPDVETGDLREQFAQRDPVPAEQTVLHHRSRGFVDPPSGRHPQPERRPVRRVSDWTVGSAP
ncbi:hypothetical protein HDA45_006179 [Amycolatopsis umgeniensis]|uniref:Uncharacterized protein n=1 Tax=Amycolatopsis umgeniensis TaxID=336628 RepID=A0A841BBZ8_9PSEU|nr:hypothetical protein [Amycolatopsis umgeniensis]